MNHRRTLVAVGLLFSALFGAWFMAGFNVPVQQAVSFSSVPYVPAEPIVVYSRTKGDETSYAGSFPLQPPCSNLATGVSVVGTDAPKLSLAFTTLQPTAACADTAATVTEEFGASFASLVARKPTEFGGITVNGVAVNYKLIKE